MTKSRTTPEQHTSDQQQTEEILRDPQMSADLQHCRSLCQNPLISERTRAAYHSMFADLCARRAGDMIQQNIEYLHCVIIEARSYTTMFQTKITQALASQWISAESAARWQQRFFDSSLLECIRKHWFHEHFEGLWNNWKNTAEKREHLLPQPMMKELTSRDIPRLATFQNRSIFLALHWREQSALVAEVDAALKAKQFHQEHFYHECATMLRGWSSGQKRFLHPSKVGPWLERIFAGTFSTQDRRTFLQNKLNGFRKNWERLRHQFDTIEEEFHTKGIPQGFWVPSLDDFLSWHVRQRETYITEAKSRLRSPLKESPELTALMADIRHDLDSRDYEGAAHLLSHARRKYPENLDLKSMERFLHAHRSPHQTHAPEHANPDQMLKEMRAIVSQIDDSVRPLYVKALKEGSSVFRALTVLMFNRVWLHRTGRYLNPTLEAEQQKNKEYKQETRMRMRQGHTDEIERNIISGDTAKEAAINDDCTNAQILYMDSGGEDAVLARVREQRSNQSDRARGFLYQTSLIPIQLSYGRHEQIVDHFHRPLKQGLRLLEAHGKAYE